MDYDVVVIGAGPAGLMAAGHSARAGARTIVLEQADTPAQKLAITGGGRCNITNAEFDVRSLLKHYGDAEKFLYSPFSRFDVNSTFSFFESLGLPLVVEARKRAFPQSQSAQDVVDTLLRFARESGAEIHTGVQARRFTLTDGTVTALETSAGKYHAKRYILATGGLSGRVQKGKGIGMSMLSELGHTVHKPTPDLVPLKTNAKWVHRLAGVSLSFMTIRFKQSGRTFHKQTGKLLFTHFGLSGPLIINSSQRVKQHLKDGKVLAQIDLFPDTDHKALDRRLLKIFNAGSNRQAKNALAELIPAELAKEILRIVDISLEHPVHSLTREMRRALVHTLKELAVPINGTMGMDRAIVADGGVELGEIDFKTMQSRIHESVHVVGDLLNIRRPSGGYSLQLCWTTGFVAGSSAGKAVTAPES